MDVFSPWHPNCIELPYTIIRLHSKFIFSSGGQRDIFMHRVLQTIICFISGCLLLAGPAEALRIKTNWAERVDLSEKVFRGEVVEVTSRWNPEKTGIYTDVTFLIDEHVKGIGESQITIRIPGGTVGDMTQWVSDTARFEIGDYGVILLEPSGHVTGGADGVHLLQKASLGTAQIHPVTEDRFLSWIREYANGRTRHSFEELDIEVTAKPLQQTLSYSSISGVSPPTISAGTDSILTITGNGFGPSRGASDYPTIAFRYKSGNYWYDNNEIVSWSDNEIRVRVFTFYHAGDNYTYSPGSWNDTVAFVNSSGIFEYYYPLTVTFGYGSAKWSTSAVSYYVNTTLGPSGAAGAVQAASNTWSGAGADFSFGYAGSTSAGLGRDGFNVISFANLGSSTIIGQASSWISGGFVIESDIQFNTNFSWSTATPTPAGSMDLESIALHELGHWLRLLDLYGANDSTKAMYGFGSYGAMKRILESGDRTGIQWIYPAVCSTPGVPSGPSPGDGATGLSASPTLNWANAPNADSYDVYFGTSSNPPYAGNTTSPNYPRSGLSYNTTYYWKIAARNNCGNSTSGSVWSFTTAGGSIPETVSTPTVPTGGPSQGTGIVGASYSFTASGAISSFSHSVEYQFDWIGDGTVLSSWGTANRSNSWPTPGTYFVRVRGRCTLDPSIVSFWSPTLTVRIFPPPPPVDNPPFGSFDIPLPNTTTSGAIQVGGWALDDVGVAKIELRSDIPFWPYIGDLYSTCGTRPDVYDPTYPNSNCAGWGYIWLTNFMTDYRDPQTGQKVLEGSTHQYFLRIYDTAGHFVDVGHRNITIRNDQNANPFGAIDGPSPGGILSGSVNVVGWALARGGQRVSRVRIALGGQVLGEANYGLYRADVEAAFPGYADSGGSGLVYVLDTTLYSNGMYELIGVVTDDGNHQDGIGSRWIYIQN